MTSRTKKALLAAVGALTMTVGAAVGPWVPAAHAVVPAGVLAGVGTLTSTGPLSDVDYTANFQATGVLVFPPSASVVVDMTCTMNLDGEETLLAGQGSGWALCDSPDGSGFYTGISTPSPYVRVGGEIVFTATTDVSVGSAFGPALVVITLTFDFTGTIDPSPVVATIEVVPALV